MIGQYEKNILSWKAESSQEPEHIPTPRVMQPADLEKLLSLKWVNKRFWVGCA